MTSKSSKERDQDGFYPLTGELMREWVELELGLSMWLPDLLGIDGFRSRVLWNSYGDLRSKLNLLKTLIRNFADESLWQEAAKIFASVEQIAENRHILAHTFGNVDEGANKLVFNSDKLSNDFILNFVDEQTVASASVKDWLRDMQQCQQSIAEFKRKLGSGVHDETLMHRRQSGTRSRV